MRRYTRNVAEEVSRLREELWQTAGSQGVRANWLQLCRDVVGGGKWTEADFEEARLILNLGWEIAMADRDYRAAADLLRSYLSHPEIDRADATDRTIVRSRLATSLLYVGDEAEALDIYFSLLDRKTNCDVPIAALNARGYLLEFFEQCHGADMASVAMTDFVYELVRRLGRGRSPGKRPPGGATYARLIELLDSTFQNRPSTHPATAPEPAGGNDAERVREA
jgi:hypothetical protein